MSRSSRGKAGRPTARRTDGPPAWPPGRRWAAGAALAIVVLGGAIWWRADPPVPDNATGAATRPASYIGSRACESCHTAESSEWASSQHAGAMATATDATVRGDFDDAQVSYGGVTSTFFRREGRYFVRTDGADGHLAEFEIAYTFGLEPLQQYLIALSGGRLQALSIAWDARPAGEGGQRWFHLYPGEVIAAGDPLHWTGRDQNWNFMCADCHATNLRKGYDVASRTFETTWSEIGVGCEACHGPGSAHAAQARAGSGWTPGYGLVARLTERDGVRWTFDRAAGIPARSDPRTTDIEIEACARCHARREQLTDDWRAGEPFENGFRPSLLDPVLYHADGQQRDEVYTYGSFVQSRMYAKGVTCSDCHNPHTGQLRLAGNATCTQCHQDPRFDSPAHHFHDPGSPGAACVSCHMPTTTYMQVDPRHDHGFRVPRPDLTTSLGVPNSCTMNCHADRGAAWASAQIERVTGRQPGAPPAMAVAFAAFDNGTAEVSALLRQIATDRDQPAIARGSALVRLATRQPSGGLPLDALLGDTSAMVRRAALAVVRTRGEAERLRLAGPMLADPVMTVRIAAASALADLADRLPAGAGRDRFETAFGELVAEQRFNGDRPQGQVNLGTAWMARGRTAEAIAAFREAIAIDATFAPAYVNLADAYRVQGNEPEAYATLRGAVDRNPSDAAARHALGLSLVRQRRLPEAIDQLERAARLDPGSPRYAYVYGVALHDAGRTDEALAVLRASLARHPDDVDMLVASALYSERAGRLDEARGYLARLVDLRPDDATVRDLVARIGTGR